MSQNIKSVALQQAEIEQSDTLAVLFNKAIRKGLPVALWRAPHEQTNHLIIQLDQHTVVQNVNPTLLPSGFVFAPFESSSQWQSHFIKSDITFVTNSIHDHITGASEQDLEKLENAPTRPVPKVKTTEDTKVLNDEHYISLVDKAVKAIQRDEFQKVVPARMQKIDLPDQFSVIKLFTKLCDVYKATFNYVVFIPDCGMWCGATPEQLIRQDANGIFKTTALAGTQPYIEDTNPADAVWRQKEIEEQAMVSRYIIDCFKKIRLREFTERGPKTVKAGNLLHLKTDFIVDLNAVDFKNLSAVMLDLLHPTSAICGMPKEASLDFLHREEHLDRAYYSGFLGPINYNDEIDTYVNLRCMHIQEKTGVLYAGAGVTVDSIPERELTETQFKMNTLLEIIGYLK